MQRLITFQQILIRATPDVLRLNWPKYGSAGGYSFFDDNGLPIRTGILHGFMGAKETYLGCCRVSGAGHLANPEKSFRMLVRKCQLVQENDALTSLPYRDPEAGDWGGGINIGAYTIEDTSEGRWLSTLGDDPLVSCITGLPDIADHLLNAHLLQTAGIFKWGDAGALLSADLPGMPEAMEWAGMSKTDFTALSGTIELIVRRARRELGG